ncbi:MAG: 50S ribosomal protein L2 [Aigarchaeota archaeon]|nr:50S ribosomal protein L2 [Aigarchaeota archaeon]MCX8193422.1 50S ribosomal protein L2 [Nitrososphaeria archaeon]MDW7985846.1 50S ribosomal protein L2 [Nitrososphaerota archaeon]
MGRRIRAQRIGRGSPTFRGSLKRTISLGYPSMLIRSSKLLLGYVKELHHDSGRGAPVAEIALEDGRTFAMTAVEGLHVGQIIEMGMEASIKTGNIVPLEKVPEGTMVSMVELKPGDCGKLVRAGGTYAIVMSQLPGRTVLLMPSKKMLEVSSKSLAIIGAVAGGGLHDKPFLKAGKKHHWMKAKHRPYPRVRGVAMVPAFHPFGGTRKKIGRPETVSRNAPPGRKVGLISAKRTGRRKR